MGKVVTSAKMSVAFLLVGFVSSGNSLLSFDLFSSSSSSSSLSSLSLLWIFWFPNIDLGLNNNYIDLAKPKSGAPRPGCFKPD